MAEENKYSQKRWSVPHKRAKGYAEERKAKVHKWGPKEGQELTTYEAGLRSGYLQCQSDHSELYWYKREMAEGADAIKEARAAKRAAREAKAAEKAEVKEKKAAEKAEVKESKAAEKAAAKEEKKK